MTASRSIKERLLSLQNHVKELAIKAGRDPRTIAIVSVSKYHSVEQMTEAFEAGSRDFGESRVQEFSEKFLKLPEAIRSEIHWHFIGTLQKNKVNKVVGQFDLIHSVDSLELAQKISESSRLAGVSTAILLQANTSGEISKHGLSAEQWKSCFEQVLELPAIQMKGLMTMAPLIEDESVVRRCFANLRLLKEELKKMAGESADLEHLSMGMTHDYPLAIAEGATLLRIGSAIFNSRSGRPGLGI